jgi:hypothetical protein
VALGKLVCFLQITERDVLACMAHGWTPHGTTKGFDGVAHRRRFGGELGVRKATIYPSYTDG